MSGSEVPMKSIRLTHVPSRTAELSMSSAIADEGHALAPVQLESWGLLTFDQDLLGGICSG